MRMQKGTRLTVERKKSGLGKGCLIVVGALIVLGVIGQMAGNGEDPAKKDASVAVASAPQPTLSQEEVALEKPASSLTVAQENAVRNAEQYLSMAGFSRNGLVEQLSSDAGNGYAKADAIAAVDSLNVDWNEQAVRSAKQYLEISGFSCKGLIEQLSSSAGHKFTRSQAEYGAKQAGAC